MIKALLRIIVGLIFIASGFVKAVDLVGFSFKLEEYFSPVVFNMPFLEEFALAFAIIVVALELLLGIMLVVKAKLRFTLAALIVLCVFFGFLTFYSAYFNVVTDCGCFGDAIKFTPWESFIKDIVLLLALIILFILYRKEFRNDESNGKFKAIVIGLFSVVMIFIMSRGILHEPMIDFRHYKIGTNLVSEREKIAKNPSEYKTYYSLKNTTTGEVININQDDYINDKKYWQEGTPWKIEEGKNESKLIKEGYQSEISKFKLEDETGNDITEEVLKAPKAILLFSYKPKEASLEIINQAIAKAKTQGGIPVYGVSTQPKTFPNIPNLLMDGTAIKTIARSNPFVMVLQNGKIIEKLPAKDYVN